MAGPGQYSEILRLVGQFLDQEQAHEIEVVDRGVYITASWQGSAGAREERTYRTFEFTRLLEDARRLRGEPGPAPLSSSFAETLRALGSECDQSGTELLSLVELPDGYRVTGLATGKHVSYTYDAAEVQELVADQRAHRA